jgi:hypothetical protein
MKIKTILQIILPPLLLAGCIVEPVRPRPAPVYVAPAPAVVVRPPPPPVYYVYP